MQSEQIDFEIIIPLPHIDVSEEDLYEINTSFNNKISINSLQQYPIAPCFLEIIVYSLVFLGGSAANHYADKLWQALDKIVKKKFDQFHLTITSKDQSTRIALNRSDSEDSIAKIKAELMRLENEHRNK